jgi:DNA-directed RNA polymerase specialized sigma24 family protein
VAFPPAKLLLNRISAKAYAIMTHLARSARTAIDKALLHDRDALEVVLLLRYEWLEDVARQTIPAALREKVSVNEVLDETFVRALRNFSTFSPETGEASLFQWLKSVVQGAARDALRRGSAS